MSFGQFSLRALNVASLGRLPLLDVVAKPDADSGMGFTLFFAKGVALDAAKAQVGENLVSAVMLNGAPILQCNALPQHLTTAQPEFDIFAGKNIAISTRNGEPVERVLNWLEHHYDFFAMDGAVIFNRARQGNNKGFITELKSAIEACKKPLHVLLVESSHPLGAADLPPEAHPFCAGEAPGRDRMKVPNADPWTSPLAEMSIYEIARQRFLQTARAIINIDICDLLYDPVLETPGRGKSRVPKTPFDIAVERPGKSVKMIGRHCYPWQFRGKAPAQFADHICVQFDKPRFRNRWCVSPQGLAPENRLRLLRISAIEPCSAAGFYRHMAIRHPVNRIGRLVAKASLVESPSLLAISTNLFKHKPMLAPKIKVKNTKPDGTRTAIVTTMKNEGPFILEWIAYHQAIGVNDFLIYTNDCSDGTDTMFDLLQSKGFVQHRQNPFKNTKLKPQHAALQAADKEPLVQQADWLICMDVDEFINIKVGDGRLEDLYQAVGNANLISCTWRLFGNSNIHQFSEEPTIKSFTRCAPEFSPKPHHAWGFKTLFRNTGSFKKMGVHRPKGLQPQLLKHVRWVNGSGKPMPKSDFRNAWRSTKNTYGYDLVSLNHYAVRNAESFLVKRDRGRVNHVDRDQGLAYWFRMNNNAALDRSIQKRIPMMEEKLKVLMADPDIARQHYRCVAAHKDKIAALKENKEQMELYQSLTSARMEKLSTMHRNFGSNVFFSGPQCIPDDIVWADHPKGFSFTVERQANPS